MAVRVHRLRLAVRGGSGVGRLLTVDGTLAAGGGRQVSFRQRGQNFGFFPRQMARATRGPSMPGFRSSHAAEKSRPLTPARRRLEQGSDTTSSMHGTAFGPM
jgi:hypothetical protein